MVARSGRLVPWMVPLLALLAALSGAGCSSAPLSCPAGQTACGGTCVDLSSDALHCGACNTTCDAGASCVSGLCGCPSSAPLTCGLRCVDPQTDGANCGRCGHACGLGQCRTGACSCNTSPGSVALCPDDPTTGTCVDLAASASNCGACGNVCTSGETCASCAVGEGCVGKCVCSPPKQVCGTGSAAVCTNVSTDPANCGSCGNACAAGQVCSGGTCQQTCAAGFTLCGTSCVDLRTDPQHCGSCTNACLLGQSCSGGTCQAACTTLTCGGSCCPAPLGSATCCGTSCPVQHKDFVGTTSEITYYNCAPAFVWTLETARTAARAWAPGGNEITPTQSCPNLGGSLCLVWQKALLATDVGCAVFCYSGPFQGAATVTRDYTCPCPTTQQLDWY